MVRLSNATISHITIDRVRRYLEVDYYIEEYLHNGTIAPTPVPIPMPVQSKFSLYLYSINPILTNNTYIGYEIFQGTNATSNLTYISNIIIDNPKIQFNLTFNSELSLLSGVYYGDYIYNLNMKNGNNNIVSAIGYNYVNRLYFNNMFINLPYLPI